MASTAHVPAWRRLGLKLKHESTDTTPAPPVSNNTDLSSKRRSREDSGFDETDHNPVQTRDGDWWKRRKQEEKRRFEESVNFIPVSKARVLPQSEQQTASKTETPVAGKRKSVSFTPDTKVNTLAEAGEASGSTEARPAAADEDAKKRYTEFTETKKAAGDNSKPKPKGKLSRKEKARQAKDAKSVNNDWHPKYLDYLTDFYHSRDTWKFNKASQTHLLRHIFNLDRVPWKYSAELAAYLDGLKGVSIREKLRIEAVRICEADDQALSTESMDKDEEATNVDAEENAETISRGKGAYALVNHGNYDGPTPEERKKVRKQALEDFKRELKNKTLKHEEWDLLKNPEQKKLLQTRCRAEEVLWLCGGPSYQTASEDRFVVPHGEDGYTIRPGVVEHVSAEESSAVNGKTKRKRKRKRRTGVPDDDSSSDETSSSDSDSEEDILKRRRSTSPISVSSRKGNGSQEKDSLSVRSLTPVTKQDRGESGPKDESTSGEDTSDSASSASVSDSAAPSHGSRGTSASETSSDDGSDGSESDGSPAGSGSSDGSQRGSETSNRSGSGDGSGTGSDSDSGTSESGSEGD